MRQTFLATCLFLATVAPAAADKTGVDFQTMPKGCRWHTDYSGGEHFVSEFLGKKRGKYVVETREGGADRRLINRTEYNASGQMVARIWSDGARETFTPFSCYTVPGACSYEHRRPDGSTVVIDSKVAKKGKGYSSKAAARNEAPYPDETFQLGPFRLLAVTRSPQYWSKIVKFEGCGLLNS